MPCYNIRIHAVKWHLLIYFFSFIFFTLWLYWLKCNILLMLLSLACVAYEVTLCNSWVLISLLPWCISQFLSSPFQISLNVKPDTQWVNSDARRSCRRFCSCEKLSLSPTLLVHKGKCLVTEAQLHIEHARKSLRGSKKKKTTMIVIKI